MYNINDIVYSYQIRKKDDSLMPLKIIRILKNNPFYMYECEFIKENIICTLHIHESQIHSSIKPTISDLISKLNDI